MSDPRDPNEVRPWSVWAVVVHYGSPSITLRVLRHLEASTYPASVVVIDNSSNFDAPSGVRLIVSSTNLGFAGGANIGARKALDEGADLVWFINNDAEPSPDALERLIETAAEASPACIVGSLEVDPLEGNADGGWAYRLPALPTRLRGSVRSVRSRLGSVDFVSGFSMLVSRPTFERIGFLDESYFHFCEDVDYSLRAVLNGVDVVLDGGAPVLHRRSTAMGRGSSLTSYYFFRNRLLLAARYRHRHPIVTLLVADPRRMILPLISPRRIANREWGWLRGAWRGTVDALRSRSGPVS